MCPLEHEWPATYKVEAPLRLSRNFAVFETSIERRTGCRVCIPSYYKTMNYLYKFRLKNVDAAFQFGFREISRYSRHSSSAEPDVGCIYHHTIQRWTIYISSDSKTLTRRYGLAFEKFCDIRDIYRAPNRMPGVYTIKLYNEEPSI